MSENKVNLGQLFGAMFDDFEKVAIELTKNFIMSGAQKIAKEVDPSEAVKLKDLSCQNQVAVAKGLIFWTKLDSDNGDVKKNKSTLDKIFNLLKAKEFTFDKVPELDWKKTCEDLRLEGQNAFNKLHPKTVQATDSWENSPLHDFIPCEGIDC
jgi:hypothetical protein